jgi:glycosyltransferase involved in cell wall biosynthesis
MLNLFQFTPRIRLRKYAEILSGLGFPVIITHTHVPVENISWEGYRMMKAYRSYDIRRSVSAVLSFNPNVSVFGGYSRHRRVECVGDLVSYEKQSRTEKYNLESADQIIFVSDVQMEQAIEKYHSIEHKSHVIYNGMVSSLMQEPLKPRRDSDKLRIVWAGSLANQPGHHRVLHEEFKKIASLPGVELHIYAYPKCPEEYFHIGAILHAPVAPEKLVSELSQYDVGLILWKDNPCVASASLPNKFFEMTAAGLKIAAMPYRQLTLMDTDNLCFFEEYQELIEISPPSPEERIAISSSVITYEAQSEKIRSIIQASMD